MKNISPNGSFSFENSIYDESIPGSSLEDEVFGEEETIDSKLKEIATEEALSKLDIKVLNNKKAGEETKLWRNGPAPLEDNQSIKDIKIGSLCGSSDPNEERFENFQDYIKKASVKSVLSADRALISYFAYVGTLGDTGEIDLSFVQDLIKAAGGSNHEVRDIYDQSLLHEVAREWHTDIAMFLLLLGININAADKFGRTPLYVAVAVNNTLMTEWLIKHGANIHHRTISGQGQTAMHFAAKYDSIECFDILLRHGCNPLERDDEGKTPIYLAAEYGQSRMCSHLIEMELPVASYANDGTSVIDHMLKNLHESVAYKALNQFITIDPRSGKRKYYISCLGKRRWRLLNHDKHIMQRYVPPDPLDIIVERNNLHLITHPIILKLLELKFSHFARKYISLNVLLTLLSTLFWTISLTMIEGGGMGYTSTNIVSFTLAALAQCITIFHIVKLVTEFKVQRQENENEKLRLKEAFMINTIYVHPRWPIEQHLLEKQEEMRKRRNFYLLHDGWTAIEVLCLLMSTIEFIVYILWINADHLKDIDPVHQYYAASFLIVLWIRLNRSFRYFQSLGPFIAMLGECLIATTQFAFLFFEFFIPFAASFWIMFGGKRQANPNGSEYEDFNNMLYQLYLLTIVGDYEYQPLQAIDKITSQILIGIYFLLVSIVSLNLYIALLSEAFARVNQTASAIAYMKEASEIINIEQNLPEVKRNFEYHSNDYYAPLIIKREDDKTNLESINFRSRLVFCGQRAKELNKSFEYTRGETEEIVHGFTRCCTSMKDFEEKYSENIVEDMIGKLDDVFDFQTASVSKIHRKTRSLFSKMVDMGRDQIEKIKDLRDDS